MSELAIDMCIGIGIALFFFGIDIAMIIYTSKKVGRISSSDFIEAGMIDHLTGVSSLMNTRNIDFSARDNGWSSPDLSTPSVPHQSDHWGTNLANDIIREVTGADIKTGEYHG